MSGDRKDQVSKKKIIIGEIEARKKVMRNSKVQNLGEDREWMHLGHCKQF